jgi:type 1 glutamine amidotransferase
MPSLQILAVATLAFGGLALMQVPPEQNPGKSAPKDPVEKPRVLVFSKTGGFRHDSIPQGVACVREILAGRYEVDASEDSAVFTESNLRRYSAVVFLSTTGDILDAAQQAAFESYIRTGGGYAGIHAAADTEHTWPWYGQLVGAYFKTHPHIQPATVIVEDQSHRSTRMLPREWRRTDEWYVYNQNPRGRVKVLAAVDDSTIEGANMGGDHPIAWYHEFEGGRAWYTGGGHTKESFTEPLFRQHLEGGILWAANATDAAPPGADERKPDAVKAHPGARAPEGAREAPTDGPSRG